MLNNFSFLQRTMLVVASIILFIFISRWLPFHWGSLELAPTATVTVTGEADGQQTSQIANFSASVTVNHVDKETATQTVNEQMEKLLIDLKEFGITEKDLRTDQISVYEYKEPETDNTFSNYVIPPNPSRNGQLMWQASNTINIILRDIDRASELATLLTKSEATDISGPSFTVDDTTDLDRQLLTQAMEDAQAKAELLLAGTNQKIKRIISVSETGTSPSFSLPVSGGGVRSDSSISVPVEPGSRTIYKSVVVTFEIGR